MNRKKIFFTSDLHIGHLNSIKFDNRPFTDLHHMHSVLANNYNSTVPEDGVCYFLGDSGLCKSDELSKFMKRLNGSTKILILGNHDRNTYSMYDQGFDVVLNSAILYIGDKRIGLSHCPLPGIKREDVTGMKGSQPGENWHGEFKNERFMNFDTKIDYLIHGHIHSTKENGKPKYTDKQYDVGVANSDYRPVSISEIESWIALEEGKKK